MQKLIKKFELTTVCLFIGSGSVYSASKDIQNEKKPNIIVFIIDDAGYADFGFMGSKDLKTPNIDKLANDGVIFTDAYVSATVSGPSRAGILTGRYQQRFGFECNPDDDKSGIALSEQTIANAMKMADYTTAAFGKWHMGSGVGYRPNERGFDYFWGFLSGGRSYFPNDKNDVPNGSHAVYENLKQTKFSGYLTDVLADKAAKFIHKQGNNPFFIYWAPNAVHTPMEATADDLKRFEGHPRQTLAAMTWALDRAVGKIVTQLKKDKLYDNTLMFFLSDNGGSPENTSSNLPLKGFKGNKYEGGMRVPFFVTWKKQLSSNTKFNGLSSSLDIFATAIDVANFKGKLKNPIDGVSLIPYLKNNKTGHPHNELFWRKDQSMAVRMGEFKLVNVNNLPLAMYNLKNDLGETENLALIEQNQTEILNNSLKKWSEEMIEPLWTEGKSWDTITWMIHQDLIYNRKVRLTNQYQLKQYKSVKKK